MNVLDSVINTNNRMSNCTKEDNASDKTIKTENLSNERETCLRAFISKLGAKSGQNAKANVKNPVLGKGFCSIAAVLSNGGGDRADIQKYLDPDSQMGIGAVCSFPSFDLGDEELILPSVGSSSLTMTKPSSTSVPNMRASILGLKDLKTSQNQTNCLEKANENATVLEQAAARNLASATTWTRSTVHLASLTMLRSLAQSYVSLVESRVKAWTLLLLRKSLSSGDRNSRDGLLQLLATSHSLHLSSVSISFQTLANPNANTALKDTNEADLILPLLFEAVMTVSIQDQDLPVKLRCPGIVLGKFSPETTLLSLVKINLDANSLVSSMVEQARLAVFKAVAVATNAASASPVSTIPQFHTALNLSKSPPRQSTQPETPPNKQETLTNKLNEHCASSKVLLTKAPSLTFSKTRKNRSVTWNHQLESSNNNEVRNAKRRKFSATGVLKSSRSFGKPDASFFETNRNATFAEFGRPPMHLFVNGKLATPNNNTRFMANIRTMKSVGNFSSGLANGASKGNAVFSAASLSLSQKLHLTTSSTADPMDRKTKPNHKPTLFSLSSDRKRIKVENPSLNTPSSHLHIPQPSLPRTPTALEGFLLAKTASNAASFGALSKQQSLKRSLPAVF